MASKCLLSREALLLYAGKTYTTSEKLSLKKGTTMVVGIIPPKTNYTQVKLDALTPYERENWKLSLKRYNKAQAKVPMNLTSLYSVLWGQIKRPQAYKTRSRQMITKRTSMTSQVA